MRLCIYVNTTHLYIYCFIRIHFFFKTSLQFLSNLNGNSHMYEHNKDMSNTCTGGTDNIFRNHVST